ncbi:fimbrial biogenesis chaperone [Enterobacter ludwigii]
MMNSISLIKKIVLIISLCAISLSTIAKGGISVSGTRIIYPKNAKQEIVSIRNSSDTDSFLVQSWVESAEGKKTNDFIVTPPLYLSSPGNENRLRVIFTGSEALPEDRETLYYFIAKAIPSVTNETTRSSIVRISAASRIKVFVRPDGLSPSSFEAPQKLSLRVVRNKLEIDNPTPYYITISRLNIAGKQYSGLMIEPKTVTSVAINVRKGDLVKFNAINDYGALSKDILTSVK